MIFSRTALAPVGCLRFLRKNDIFEKIVFYGEPPVFQAGAAVVFIFVSTFPILFPMFSSRAPTKCSTLGTRKLREEEKLSICPISRARVFRRHDFSVVLSVSFSCPSFFFCFSFSLYRLVSFLRLVPEPLSSYSRSRSVFRAVRIHVFFLSSLSTSSWRTTPSIANLCFLLDHDVFFLFLLHLFVREPIRSIAIGSIC